MQVHRLQFSGAILERGFWLYTWRIRDSGKEFFYVGRTGDSSSQFAASPFSRIGQHLDVRPKATANMLLRHIRTLKLDPLTCSYELIALGPIFPEQPTLALHRKYRDQIAPLEGALADMLRASGRVVVGTHGSTHKADPRLIAEVSTAFRTALGAS
jgi:hypothetical protein